MSWKNLKQLSLADSLTCEHEALTELDDINELMDWEDIEHLLGDIHAKRRGNTAWPPLFMFKALLLQCWYNLSDPKLERLLVRDLLFRRFVGLSLADSVPDHSSIWRFRQLLEKQGLMDSLLAEINRQLSSKGVYIRAGEISIVDKVNGVARESALGYASVIQAQRNRPNKDKDGHNTQDPEAGWNVKQGSDGKRKSTYGFKAHANVDEDGFIKATAFTAGNVHDSNHFTDLLSGKETEVYADSAYKSKKHDDWLEDHHVDNKVIERAYRNTPLTPEQKKKNQRNSGTRCTVERVFGVLKLHYGMGQARYLGLARNSIRFGVMCLAYNLRRGANINKSCETSHYSCA
jgi:IS5 family transposase